MAREPVSGSQHRFSFISSFLADQSAERGSAILALFGAIAMLGVIGVGLNTVIRGPVSTMADVTKRTVAESNMVAGSKLAVVMAPTAQASGGDCDNDGYVEPFPYRDAGSGPKPTGGGYIPTAVGSSLTDPWMTQYGYCAWDAGPKSVPDNVAACGGTTALRLKGAPNAGQPVIAIISAGKDRIFQTACNAYVDANNDGVPDTALVVKAPASDDMVMTYTYAEANNATGSSLWAVKPGTPTTATIAKDVEVNGNTILSGTLRLGGGLILPGDPGTDAVTGPCNAANDQQIRRNTSTNPPKLEICNFSAGFTAWQVVSGAGGTADNLGNHIATQALSMSGFKITGVATPTLATDAASLSYLNTASAQIVADTGKSPMVWGWGSGYYGQTGEAGNTPIPSIALSSGSWLQVGANNYHNCGIKIDGTLWCWGLSYSGNLGDGSNTFDSVIDPVKVGAATNWAQVSTGSSLHTCAIKSDGTLWCWGNNGSGQLGNGAASGSLPAQVGVATNWKQVNTGTDHTCAIKTDGTLWCWGRNSYGGLGDGTTTDKSSPTQVGALTSWAQVSLGSAFSCARRTDGTLWCWGYNNNGQLGDGTTVNKVVPTRVGAATNWAQIAVGGTTSCGLQANGTAWCWGVNGGGQVGDGTTTSRSSPVQVGAATNWTFITTSPNAHSCGLQADNTLWCWGNAGNGELGDGTTVNKSVPTKITTETSWVSVALGYGYTIAIRKTLANDARKVSKTGDTMTGPLVGLTPVAATDAATKGYVDTGIATIPPGPPKTLWIVGSNNYGQLGDGTTTSKTTHVQAGTATNWLQASSAKYDYRTCGVRKDGTLWCWGYNNHGQLGDGTTVDKTSITQVGTATNWRQAAAGFNHTCAIRTDGTLWCWGYNQKGEVGDGTTTQRTSPIQIGVATNWQQVTAGYYHTCATRTDGTLWCWGHNAFGEVGDGTTTDRYVPTQVGSLTTWVQLSAGNYHTCAIRNDGSLWCWGYNNEGELGFGGGVTSASSPTQPSLSSGYTWTQVSGGGNHTCAVQSDGSLWCWGENGNYQVGNNSTATQYNPLKVGTSGWVQVSAGYIHTCGLQKNGTLWCWGRNAGDFGDGNISVYSGYPKQIGNLRSWTQIVAGYNNSLGIRGAIPYISD